MSAGALRGAILLPVLAASSQSLRYSPRQKLGVMNKHGVTRYSYDVLISKAKDGTGFYAGDPGRRSPSVHYGATDLADNVSWGWHHPNGVYSTIPVGAPLIDANQNIYIGSDDAIRKFSIVGDLMWSYAPRGQLAAAPSLVEPTTRREAEGIKRSDKEQEDALRPLWLQGGHASLNTFKDLRVGDRVRVKPGRAFGAKGKELYRAGDVGVIAKVYLDVDQAMKAKIHWDRTGTSSIAMTKALGKRFVHIKSDFRISTPMLVGSTTSGYVFAIDLEKGEELWATQTSQQIHGVKGVVSSYGGVVVAATDRCTDRYCYRYRNLTNPLAPGNSVVRGLSAADGSALWEFKTTSPVWNMQPQYHATENTVMFSDYEGTVYSLDLPTGTLVWKAEGAMGTYTQAFAVYYAETNQIFSMGVQHYNDKFCNPFPAPGILHLCGTWPGKAGWVRGHNASSGYQQWETEITEPPAAAAVGKLNSPREHTRLVVAMGHNCWYNSRSAIWAFDPQDGAERFRKDGPTLWTDMCAGDKEGGDIRRAMGGRAACYPGSWSTPAIDAKGDIYIGSQVGELQRWGTTDGKGGGNAVKMISSLTTGVAFQDSAISLSRGLMAVSTCTSLIVFQTSDDSPYLASNVSIEPSWDKSVATITY